MELDYSGIFSCFVNLFKIAFPISLFLTLADVMINWFFSLAFPKHVRRVD